MPNATRQPQDATCSGESSVLMARPTSVARIVPTTTDTHDVAPNSPRRPCGARSTR